jgi:oxalate decarboxylase
MSDNKKDKLLRDGPSRRSVLGMVPAVFAAAAFGEPSAYAREGTHQTEGDHSSSNSGQENKPLLAENPNSITLPPADREDPFAGLVSAC